MQPAKHCAEVLMDTGEEDSVRSSHRNTGNSTNAPTITDNCNNFKKKRKEITAEKVNK
jgi:hypothetical protein